MTENRRRNDISIKTKLEIIAECDKVPKQTFSMIAEKFKIDRSTVSKTYKAKSRLLQTIGSSPSSRKRQRHSAAEQVDHALYSWFVSALSTNIPISGEVLRIKAEKFALELSIDNFKATDGFIDRWKKRYGIIYKKSHGEKLDANEVNATQWISTVLPGVLNRYSLSDIFNADETGLYYRALPRGSHTFKSSQLEGGKISKERLTILVCASMMGEKSPLVMIGKSKNPRCFKGVKELPIEYHNNRNAWMTAVIFEKWLVKWNRDLMSKNRRIALILDNCGAHPNINLENIELIFLPPNVTPLIQPLDQGVIRNLKQFYRRMVVIKLLTMIESTENELSAVELSRKLDLLSSIRLIKEAWKLVTPNTIINCFSKARFGTELDSNLQETEINVNLDNGDDFDFDEFVRVDQEIECIEPINENEITSNIIENIRYNDINDASDENNNAEVSSPHENITSKQALDSLNVLQNFLVVNNENDFSVFNSMERQVQLIILRNRKKLKQRTLDEWFDNK